MRASPKRGPCGGSWAILVRGENRDSHVAAPVFAAPRRARYDGARPQLRPLEGRPMFHDHDASMLPIAGPPPDARPQ
jgi:hypothetical protein